VQGPIAKEIIECPQEESEEYYWEYANADEYAIAEVMLIALRW
jgi:hypothetical protein